MDGAGADDDEETAGRVIAVDYRGDLVAGFYNGFLGFGCLVDVSKVGKIDEQSRT